jgi:hypothetical protein
MPPSILKCTSPDLGSNFMVGITVSIWNAFAFRA